MDRGAWQATVHRVTKSWTWLKLLSTDAHIYHWISTLAWKKSYDKSRQHIKKQRHHLMTKVHLVKAVVFHTWLLMWELDDKETWEPKNWRFWTVGLEKTLESPLDCTEIKPVNPKGNQSWIFIGSWIFIDAEAETPILLPPDVKNWLIGKDPNAGKDWRHEKKGMT